LFRIIKSSIVVGTKVGSPDRQKVRQGAEKIQNSKFKIKELCGMG
jgi:hypothetical protein